MLLHQKKRELNWAEKQKLSNTRAAYKKFVQKKYKIWQQA